MILSNFHTHTSFSDGKKPARNYCDKAIVLGFKSLGFSDHAPVLFPNKYSIEPKELMNYFSEIEDLKKEYKDRLKIYLSLEADYIPNHSYSFSYFREKAAMDYLIGSIHLVYQKQKDRMWFIDGGDQKVWDQGLQEIFDGEIKKAVEAFYNQTQEMIESQKPDVVGHLDKIKMHNKERLFSVHDTWYKDMVANTLSLIKNKDIILEINTRGLYKGRCKELFPSIPIIQQAQNMGIPLMLSSDAHHPDELDGDFLPTIELLKREGIGELHEFVDSKWKSVLL